MPQIKRWFAFVKTHPGFVLLVTIVSIVLYVSFKPGLYILGWDNYSSFFDLPSTIWKTLFATWRAHRGVGVPSDTEVVDVFRQIFYLLVSPFIAESLLEQVYMLGAFVVGTVSLYWFAYLLLAKHFAHKSRWWVDCGALVAALFYMFNLNTAATFYFPIITYVNRYYALPVTFLLFLHVFEHKKHSYWQLLLFGMVIIFMSGSFITGTIFITTFLALSVFSFFETSWKKALMVIFLFLGLNFFWILPFASYTLEKSGIIRLAPTFIEANELQLNKNPGFFALDKQLSLYSSFFESKYQLAASDTEVYMSDLPERTSKGLGLWVLYGFPFLYLVGSFTILLKLKSQKRLIWIPVLILGFLFLSLNEYWWGGGVFKWLSETIPYFKVLFRFGDTKFHPYIAFAGSMGAAVGLVNIFSYAKRHTKWLMWGTLGVILVSNGFLYQHYWQGNLIGLFMYNDLPSAYKESAKVINNDPGNGRVLHLPFVANGYWRSYTWGPNGSAFFHYLLTKPYIDKTFEPASQENAAIDIQVASLLEGMQHISSFDLLQSRMEEFYQFLRHTGVEYIVLDESVSADIPSRGIRYWGVYNYSDAKRAVDWLIEYKQAEQLQEFTIPPIQYGSVQNTTAAVSLRLIKIKETYPQISFLPSVTKVDSHLTTPVSLTSELNTDFMQKDAASILYPFFRTDAILETIGDTLTYQLAPAAQDEKYILKTTDTVNPSYVIELTGRKEKTTSIISFYKHDFPTINGKEYKTKFKDILIPTSLLTNSTYNTIADQFANNWHILGSTGIGSLRLAIGKTVVPISRDLTEQETHLAFVTVHESKVPISVLVYKDSVPLPEKEFVTTTEPNCFGDKLAGFSYSLDTTQGVKLTTKNGSTCLVKYLNELGADEISHAELGMDLVIDGTDLDSSSSQIPTSVKPQLTREITNLPKPVAVRVCLKQSDIDDCLNSHNVIVTTADTHIYIPFDTLLRKKTTLLAFVAASTVGQQEVTVVAKDLQLYRFKTIANETIDVGPTRFETTMALPAHQPIQITIPKTFSPFSYFAGPTSGFYMSTKPCETTPGYRTYRKYYETWFSYVQNCANQLSHEQVFNSSNFLLWTINYNLLSGSFPKFVLNENTLDYKDEYVSINQGYPDIPGFLSLQSRSADRLFQKQPLTDFIKPLPFQTAYTFVGPKPEYTDEHRKVFTLQQYSGNEGLVALRGFELLDLPNNWKQLALTSTEATSTYAVPTNASFEKVLPSLWKVTVNVDSKKPLLLLFNEGFDRQWELFKGPLLAATGWGDKTKSQKCNGFANCFEFIPDEGTHTYYIFYTPERLSFLGAVATLVALFLWVRISHKASFRAS